MQALKSLFFVLTLPAFLITCFRVDVINENNAKRVPAVEKIYSRKLLAMQQKN